MNTKRILQLAGMTAVIIVSVALLLPALRGGPRAPLTRARGEASALMDAIQSYNFEFGHLPPDSAEGNSNLVRVLSGDNPGRIVFMEFESSPNEDQFLDPWGNPYQFRTQNDTNLLVWSSGPNRKDETGQGDDILIERSIQQRPAAYRR